MSESVRDERDISQDAPRGGGGLGSGSPLNLDAIRDACSQIEVEQGRKCTGDRSSNSGQTGGTQGLRTLHELSAPGPVRKGGEEDRKMKQRLAKSVKILVEHLNTYGVCVIDDFLGDETGHTIFEEIISLQDIEIFEDGQVMSGGGIHEPSVRSDKITWTDGVSSPSLRYLIQLLDTIILYATKVSNNGELGKYRIQGRTRIMVACYPGGGSHYVRHVDNPKDDGRVVTAIYYLNKDWNSQTDGGTLKIYSQRGKGGVAKIDPLFDRAVFFWSDSRNPHEVLPTHKPRYAVTVWYLGDLKEQEKKTQEVMRKESDASEVPCEKL